MTTRSTRTVQADRLLLRPTEAADMLGFGRSKTYELIADGTIPSITIGKCRRIPAEALRAWVREQTAGPASAGVEEQP